jgi:hypothetical protein
VLLLNECLLLLLFISLSTQSGNFWIRLPTKWLLADREENILVTVHIVWTLYTFPESSELAYDDAPRKVLSVLPTFAVSVEVFQYPSESSDLGPRRSVSRICVALGCTPKLPSVFFACEPRFLNGAPRHEGILDEWIYSSIHSLTSTLDGGESLSSRPGRFTAGKEPLVSIG